MAIKTPKWWYSRVAKGAPWWRPLLWPISQIWAWVGQYKSEKTHPYRSSLRVISVGNLTIGGSGKTPITHEILRLLNAQNSHAVGLSKGHGGLLSGSILVDKATHNAQDVGDEPLMIAQDQPMWIAKDRALGLKAIEQTHAKIVIVDDAHQNVSIKKDLHILVVDGDLSQGQWPFGDGGIIPYGPMREGFEAGLARADIVILWLPSHEIAPDPELMKILSSKRVFMAYLDAKPLSLTMPIIAFAGIAKPWKFEATLKSLGHKVSAFHSFADHEHLDETRLNALLAEAKSRSARLVTTQKDWIKLSSDMRERILYLPIRARFTDEADILERLNIL